MESAGYGLERDRTYAYAGTVGTVGENVRRLRYAAGFKHQGRFAERAGVSQQWLSDLERGRYESPDTASLIKLAVAIGCTVDRFLVGTDRAYDAVVAGQVAVSVQSANGEALAPASQNDTNSSLSPDMAALRAALAEARDLKDGLAALMAATTTEPGRQVTNARPPSPRKPKAPRSRRG